MRRVIGLTCVLLIPALGGCATVLSGRDQKIPITTDPLGASVQVDGGGTFTTPTELNLARKDNHTLLISMPGYNTEKVEITKSLNPAFLGNIIVGGVVGGVVDYFSGAAADLSPDKAHIVLTRCAPGQTAQVHEWNAAPAKAEPTVAAASGASATPSGGGDETYSPSKSKRN